MNKTIVIIGGGIEQIYAYELAKNRFYIIGTDINPHAPCFKLANLKVIASTRNPKETLKRLKEINQEKNRWYYDPCK